MQKALIETHRISYSAPGKCILTGEHSVVYGYNAIAISLDIRCICTLDYSQHIENPKKIFCDVSLKDNDLTFSIVYVLVF